MDIAVTKIKGGKIIGLVKTEEPVIEQKVEEEVTPPKKRGTKKATTSDK